MVWAPQGPGFSEMAKKVRTNVLEMRDRHLLSRISLSVCRRKSEQLLSKDQVEGSRFKCSLPHEQRTSNTGTNVRPYGVSEYRTRRGKPFS
jgi:hypothetical protein